MSNNNINTEQIILEAAEAEFLEKGYGNAKTVAIAQRAGMSHSMLHYYFRTKEQLFQKVFKEKVQTIVQMFDIAFKQNITDFTALLTQAIETQFKFIAQNPRLPLFVFNEIISNKENRDWAVKTIFPRILPFISTLEKMLNIEIAKGAVRPIQVQDLLLNVISINLSVFFALPVLKESFNLDSAEKLEIFLNERCKSNVQFVLNALRP